MEAAAGTLKRAKTYDILSMLFFALTAFINAYFQENNNGLNANLISRTNDPEYFVSLALCLILSTGYLLFAIQLYKIRPKWLVIGAAGLLFATNIVAVLAFPESMSVTGMNYYGQTYPVHYVLTPMLRIRYILSWGTALYFLYICFFVAPKACSRFRWPAVVCAITLIVCAVLIAYSLATEGAGYLSVFSSSEGGEGAWGGMIKSFTNHKNTFGSVLMLGVISTCYFHEIRPSWGWFVGGFVLLIEQFLISAKTSMLLSAIFLGIFLIYRFFKTYREHTKMNWICLGIIGGLAVVGSAVLFSGLLDSIGFVAKVKGVLLSFFTDFSSSTLGMRMHTWEASFALLDSPLRWIFGAGDGNFDWYLGEFESGLYPDPNFPELVNIDPVDSHPVLGYPHNGWIENLVSGGLIRLLVCVALYAYVVFVLIKNIKEKKPFALFNLIFMFTMVLYSLIETYSLLDLDLKESGFFLFYLLPALCDREEKGPSTVEEEAPILERNPASALAFNLHIATPLMLVFFCGIYGAANPLGMTSENLAFAEFGILILTLTSCIAFSLFKAEKSTKYWLFAGISMFAIIASSVVLLLVPLTWVFFLVSTLSGVGMLVWALMVNRHMIKKLPWIALGEALWPYMILWAVCYGLTGFLLFLPAAEISLFLVLAFELLLVVSLQLVMTIPLIGQRLDALMGVRWQKAEEALGKWLPYVGAVDHTENK